MRDESRIKFAHAFSWDKSEVILPLRFRSLSILILTSLFNEYVGASWTQAGCVWDDLVNSTASQPSHGAPKPSVLTTVNQLRSLTTAETRNRYLVRLRGVVMFHEGNQDIFLHDETGGIFVYAGGSKTIVHPGDLIEVEGISDPGLFAPVADAKLIKVVGKDKYPIPKVQGFELLEAGYEDSQWIMAEGIVRDCVISESKSIATLTVCRDGHRFHVDVMFDRSQGFPHLVDAEIQATGACAMEFSDRQAKGFRIKSPSLKQIEIITPGRAVQDAPLRMSNEIFQFQRTERPGHRIRVKGMVTCQWSSSGVIIQDQKGGLRAICQDVCPATMKIGDWVEVAGFPAFDAHRMPILQDSLLKTIPPSESLSPKRIDVVHLSDPENIDQYVQVEAIIQDVIWPPHEKNVTILILKSGNQIFEARLEDASTRKGNTVEKTCPGALVTLSGVVFALGLDRTGRRRTVLELRSLDDLVLLRKAPWWTIHTALVATGGFGVISLVFFGYVLILKYQVRSQTNVIRQKLEQEARLEAQYRNLFENAHDVVLTMDLQGNVLAINKAGEELLKRSREELVGLSFENTFSLESHQANGFRNYLKDLLTNSNEFTCVQVELMAKDHHGRAYPIEASFREIHKDDALIGLMAIIRDIGDRRRLEGQLRESQKLEVVGRVVGGVAHDFNNLLSVIIGCLQLIPRENQNGGQSDEHIDQGLKTAEQAVTLIRRILSFSRRQNSLEKQIVSLNDAVQEILPILNHILGKNMKIYPELILDPELPTAFLQSGHVEQILLNLCVNARDAMPCGGKIWIKTDALTMAKPFSPHETPPSNKIKPKHQLDPLRVRTITPRQPQTFPPGNYVRLMVRDQGVGVSQDVGDRLFEPFFTTKPISQNTGLGLATICDIVRQAGGWILARTVICQGTVFEVGFPAIHSHELTKE